jgi:hypothetical protein
LGGITLQAVDLREALTEVEPCRHRPNQPTESLSGHGNTPGGQINGHPVQRLLDRHAQMVADRQQNSKPATCKGVGP